MGIITGCLRLATTLCVPNSRFKNVGTGRSVLFQICILRLRLATYGAPFLRSRLVSTAAARMEGNEAKPGKTSVRETFIAGAGHRSPYLSHAQRALYI